MSDYYPKLPFDTFLAMRTAEMLALPQLVCGRRSCRRHRRCDWFFSASDEPCCLRNLDPEQRALFDTLYRRAHLAKNFLGCDDSPIDTGPPTLQPLEDAAVEIARHAPTRFRRDRWDAARRQREKTRRDGDRS